MLRKPAVNSLLAMIALTGFHSRSIDPRAFDLEHGFLFGFVVLHVWNSFPTKIAPSSERPQWVKVRDWPEQRGCAETNAARMLTVVAEVYSNSMVRSRTSFPF